MTDPDRIRGANESAPDPSTPFSQPPAVSPTPPHAQHIGIGQSTHRVGKTRNPWGVWLLSLITLGIYGLWWYYTINSELREYDDRINVQPGIALLAAFFPITNIVSWVKSGGRIGQAQRFSGSKFRCSGLVGILLALIGFGIVYYQSQINKVWDMYGNPERGTPIA
jgi:Domain of unknown function (DUF4234)